MSGFYDYDARYYDTALARFIQADPVSHLFPQGLNRYSYVLNNPENNIDPTGTTTWTTNSNGGSSCPDAGGGSVRCGKLGKCPTGGWGGGFATYGQCPPGFACGAAPNQPGDDGIAFNAKLENTADSKRESLTKKICISGQVNPSG